MFPPPPKRPKKRMEQQVTYRGRPKVPNGVAPGAPVLGGPEDDVKGPCAFMHGLCAHRVAENLFLGSREAAERPSAELAALGISAVVNCTRDGAADGVPCLHEAHGLEYCRVGVHDNEMCLTGGAIVSSPRRKPIESFPALGKLAELDSATALAEIAQGNSANYADAYSISAGFMAALARRSAEQMDATCPATAPEETSNPDHGSEQCNMGKLAAPQGLRTHICVMCESVRTHGSWHCPV